MAYLGQHQSPGSQNRLGYQAGFLEVFRGRRLFKCFAI